MGAPLGNQNNLRHKTSEERIAVVEQYCKHLRDGYMKQSFPPVHYQTAEIYAGIESMTEKVEDAEREGMKFWENVGRNGSLGIPQTYKDANGVLKYSKGFNPTSWIFIVKNKLKWTDRADHTTDGQPIQFTINAGNGFIPTSEPITTTPSGSTVVSLGTVQSTGVAQTGAEDNNGDNGVSKTGTT